jgi:hypothetical protein
MGIAEDTAKDNSADKHVRTRLMRKTIYVKPMTVSSSRRSQGGSRARLASGQFARPKQQPTVAMCSSGSGPLVRDCFGIHVQS